MIGTESLGWGLQKFSDKRHTPKKHTKTKQEIVNEFWLDFVRYLN